MDVILHIGAHRTATTSFQHYLRSNAQVLADRNIAFWGPRRTRNGLFRGILPDPLLSTRSQPVARARGRVRLNLDRCDRQGTEMLLVSDENMSGTVRENLHLGALYIGVGQRVARYCAAFDGRVSQIVLNIRSLDRYWTSALSFGLTRGLKVPDTQALNRLAFGEWGWRDVISDLAACLPGARIRVLPFEALGGRPDRVFAAVTGQTAPILSEAPHLNATPGLPELRAVTGGAGLPKGDGPWQPFDHWQRTAMRDRYAEDLHWLASGADGLAELIALPVEIKADPTPPLQNMTRGRSHDSQQRRMAQNR